MPSDYDQIRKTDHTDSLLELLSKLYSDRTHFIFELPQNAEDAGATRILFRLASDHLQVLHDGHRFTEKDVEGISW